MLNLVLFGPPGAGKGTQSNLLIDRYNLIHLSTGDILRGEIAVRTMLGLKAKKLMDQGNLIPDEVVIGMISSRLNNKQDANGFIFDGFPRTTTQSEALDTLLKEKGTSISAIVSLKVDDAELIRRLIQRGEDTKRVDDQNKSIIANRIQEYNNKTAQLTKFYSAQNKLTEVEGVGSIEDIANRLNKVIDAL